MAILGLTRNRQRLATLTALDRVYRVAVTRGADHGRFTGADARAARERLGMTQFQVAVHLGITPQHVSNFERGQHQLSRRLRVQLAEMLGLPIDDDDVPQPSVLDELAAKQTVMDAKLDRLADAYESVSEQLVALAAAVADLAEDSRRLRREQ